MRNRTAEGALFFGPLDVDVYPLMIAGHIGELVDLVLRHIDRLAPRTEVLADLRLQLFDVIKANTLHSGSFKMMRDEVARRLLFHEFVERGFQLVALLLDAQFDESVTLVVTEGSPRRLRQRDAALMRALYQPGRHRRGRIHALAFLFGQRFRWGPAFREGHLVDEQPQRIDLVFARNRSMTNHQPFAARQMLPLVEADLDAELIELAPRRHRQARKRTVNLVLELEFPNHVSLHLES